MTAVVGILNKQAIAIAADSAVTIDGNNGRKIFNKANKVFTLSKYHPVGIMIHNSASFMTTPWETIIKIYRRQLEQHSFPTVREYQEDFIRFLHSKNYYTSAAMQEVFVRDFAGMVIATLIQAVTQQNPALLNDPSDENRALFLQGINDQADEYQTGYAVNERCPEFADYTFEAFRAYADAMISAILNDRFDTNGIHLPPELDEKLRRVIFTILGAKENVTAHTGLIFVGFGEEEIYPQLIPINISMVLDNRIRYYLEEDRIAAISDMNNAAICPFAQTDVIDTILSGIDPGLENIYRNNFAVLFQKYNQEILNMVGNSNPALTAQIRGLDIMPLLEEYSNMNNRIKRENHIQPLLDAVGTLSKEDLSEMAESLIYLTYLKRRITFAEESVGGPVDVAVISKGDGFVWIKRKHYFRPELNQFFFNNYFNK